MQGKERQINWHYKFSGIKQSTLEDNDKEKHGNAAKSSIIRLTLQFIIVSYPWLGPRLLDMTKCVSISLNCYF